MECPNAELKEVKEGKRDSNPWMTSAIAFFLQSETVVGLNKNSKNRLEIFQFSGKASASPCQRRDIMAQISIDTFHREGVILIVDVVNMLSRIDYVQISLHLQCWLPDALYPALTWFSIFPHFGHFFHASSVLLLIVYHYIIISLFWTLPTNSGVSYSQILCRGGHCPPAGAHCAPLQIVPILLTVIKCAVGHSHKFGALDK